MSRVDLPIYSDLDPSSYTGRGIVQAGTQGLSTFAKVLH